MELAIHPAFRGRGFATLLLNTLLDENPRSQIALACCPFTPSHSWPKQPEALSTTSLEAWYTRYGFHPAPTFDDSHRMVRLPSPWQGPDNNRAPGTRPIAQ